MYTRHAKYSYFSKSTQIFSFTRQRNNFLYTLPILKIKCYSKETR